LKPLSVGFPGDIKAKTFQPIGESARADYPTAGCQPRGWPNDGNGS
jgi:hypothetical protein